MHIGRKRVSRLPISILVLRRHIHGAEQQVAFPASQRFSRDYQAQALVAARMREGDELGVVVGHDDAAGRFRDRRFVFGPAFALERATFWCGNCVQSVAVSVLEVGLPDEAWFVFVPEKEDGDMMVRGWARREVDVCLAKDGVFVAVNDVLAHHASGPSRC